MDYLLSIWEYLAVFVLAAIPWIEIAVVIPIAILKGLNSAWVGIVSFTGNLATVVLLIAFNEKYQQWRNKRTGKEKSSARAERGVRIWNKYGLPGLMLLGPILTGSHLAVIIGFALGGTKDKILIWSIISLGLWTVGITLASHYGFNLFLFS